MTEYKKERALVVIKPDGVQRTLVGEIIHRYERMGLKLAGLKLIVPTEDLIERQYTEVDPEWKKNVGKKAIEGYKSKGLTPPTEDPIEVGNAVVGRLKKYMTSGPVVAMVWQGAHAVEIIRKVTGGTEPRTSDVGTIRGDFVLDSYQMADSDDRAIRNLIHASGSIEDAEKEIALWFSSDELVDYRLVQEQILYDVNLDGILE
ncbi:nucleoside-diphosphate kinase [Candidatus Kaiserbacteria bacterium CG10_big_fil_rev_8_21_14_0_10_43_70]|uniref:nucleoside-diphosphate kinase n=1 Tax=Candidatus Kaiserbacteria bacterium CG10_big_fil_rev_8_21_14_0_10_43_70 TaxID=1974605 RepID=A0A2H0UIY0_9BACT|nr:MAG: nucleoside-diphosphate kinase [Candidatus Kaiserbacteria bacterium CG10_big_fil_rev_8_21_14_0_10_43_70]